MALRFDDVGIARHVLVITKSPHSSGCWRYLNGAMSCIQHGEEKRRRAGTFWDWLQVMMKQSGFIAKEFKLLLVICFCCRAQIITGRWVVDTLVNQRWLITRPFCVTFTGALYCFFIIKNRILDIELLSGSLCCGPVR